jgi:hypothetical protein
MGFLRKGKSIYTSPRRFASLQTFPKAPEPITLLAEAKPVSLKISLSFSLWL